jgi:hypothetical protein
MSSLVPKDDGTALALAARVKNRLYRQCGNGSQYQVCNWWIPTEEKDGLCLACRLNNTIPDLKVPGNQERWHKLELAKRRIVYTLLRLGLLTEALASDKESLLRFNFLGDPAGGPPVLTGHAGGLITINIAEADDAEREKRRVHLHEPYRTLLGHLRHEIAHYYWDRLIAGSLRLEAFRQHFGDETQNYGAALQNYYQQGPTADWQVRFVSAYASAHPWEDWAETWAHYLHIVDTVETAAGFGMILRPKHPDAKAMTADPSKVEKSGSDFDSILTHWLPLTYALNSLNRGMGLPDLYPFVLSERAIRKLRFVHEVILEAKLEREGKFGAGGQFSPERSKSDNAAVG